MFSQKVRTSESIFAVHQDVRTSNSSLFFSVTSISAFGPKNLFDLTEYSFKPESHRPQ